MDTQLNLKELSGIAVAVLAAGTQIKLAERLGVSQQAVSKWLAKGWVPLRRASEIEQRFNIPRHRLVNPAIVSMFQQAPPP